MELIIVSSHLNCDNYLAIMIIRWSIYYPISNTAACYAIIIIDAASAPIAYSRL